MKKIACRIIAVMLVLTLAFGFSGCNKKKTEIENLLTEFEYACNTLDFDAVLNCITPRVSDKIKVGANILGMLTFQDTDVLFEKLADVLARNSEINGTDFFESVKIDIQEIVEDEEDEDTARVMTYVTYDVAGEELVREAVFTCEYYAEKWYISSFTLI